MRHIFFLLTHYGQLGVTFYIFLTTERKLFELDNINNILDVSITYNYFSTKYNYANS